MTTEQAKRLLRCDRRTLYYYESEGRLKKILNKAGRVDWDERDVRELAGFGKDPALTVVYARTAPVNITNMKDTAETRLEHQKARLMQYCEGHGIQVDIVIGEVRNVNRMRMKPDDVSSGLTALMALLAERKIGKLIIESRDRLMVGSSWELFEWFIKEICNCTIVVVNEHILTNDSKIESKEWLTDMLQMHKIITGEIKDKKLLQQYVGGPDLKTIRSMSIKLDKKMREAKKKARAEGLKKKIVDLDDIF